jgi:hypothetical protein
LVVFDDMGGRKPGGPASKPAVQVIAAFAKRSAENAEIT